MLRRLGYAMALACFIAGCPESTTADRDGLDINADAAVDSEDTLPADGWDQQDAWWPFGSRGGPSTGTMCAAGGSVSDGNYTGVVCVGPMSLTAPATESQGYSWQPGPTYQVSP